MVVRLLTLSIAASLSLPAFANLPPSNHGVDYLKPSRVQQSKKQDDASAARLRAVMNCGEEEGAKHITLMVTMTLASLVKENIRTAFEPYNNAMLKAATCEEFSAHFKTLMEIAKQNDLEPDEFFASDMGKKAVQQLIEAYRKQK